MSQYSEPTKYSPPIDDTVEEDYTRDFRFLLGKIAYLKGAKITDCEFVVEADRRVWSLGYMDASSVHAVSSEKDFEIYALLCCIHTLQQDLSDIYIKKVCSSKKDTEKFRCQVCKAAIDSENPTEEIQHKTACIMHPEFYKLFLKSGDLQ